MKQASEIIKETLERWFPLSKLKVDLFAYLQEMYSDEYVNDGYRVPVLNKDNFTYEQGVVSEKDDMTIIIYECEYKYAIDFYFYITVGIGEYTKGEQSQALFTIEKCLAKLKYNDDLSLFDIDFYIRKTNKA